MASQLAEAAVEYLNRGFAIIALAGKMPNGKVHRHGLNEPIIGPWEGTAEDWALIEGAFDHPDTTGIGIVLPPQYVVVDIDGEEGAEQWKALAGDEAMVPTWVARTGRGLHLWFGVFQATGTIKLGPKLDLKGVGGYVAAPPSAHPDGGRYQWLIEPGDVGPTLAPEALSRRISQHLKQQERRAGGRAMRKPIRGERYKEGDTIFFAQSGFDAVIDTMRKGEEGNRNNLLHWAAATLAEDGASEEDFIELDRAAHDAGLEHVEIGRTIRSARRRFGG